MPEVQHLFIEEDGRTYEIYVESKTTANISTTAVEDERDSRNAMALVKMQQARDMIRGYTLYALNAFRNFEGGKIQEVNLKFGLKLGGKAGIPYITEGCAESNLEISVTCAFPDSEEKRD